MTLATRYRTALCLLVLATLGTLAQPAAAQDIAEQKRVLILYSTRRDSLVAEAGDRTLSRLLDERYGRRIDYYSEYIDLARFPSPQYQQAFSRFLRSKYRDQTFDAVIAIEETSLEFVAKYRDELFPGTPVIFYAVNPATTRLTNSTGVFGTLDAVGTIRLALALQPATTQVFVVSGASRRDQMYERLARAQLHAFEDRLKFTYLSGLPSQELEHRLSALPERSVVYQLLISQDGTGANFRPKDYALVLARVSNRPLYSWDETSMGQGFVGGSLRHLETTFGAVAEQTLQVLLGVPADDIPLASPQQYVAQVDWRQLRRWNISDSRVPAGTVVAFEDHPPWQRYRGYLLGAGAIVIGQALLIAGLLVQRRRRRGAERALRQSETALRTSYEHIRDIGGRLLTAQESERARIARELHDDISHQIALLEIGLRLTGNDEEALSRISGIARSVHDLSHRLHPAKLQILGLVKSLRSLEKEQTPSGPLITFTHGEIPSPLSPDLTLCVFRVVQEVLQNARKYSDATEVCVGLQHEQGELVLTISDDGTGFDVESAWGKGLGLISIQERVAANRGSLEVRSAPGIGTRIRVALPMALGSDTAAAIS